MEDLGDPQLDALMQGALESNADVRIALARVEQARAALRLARADQEPVVRAAAATRQRITKADALAATAPDEPTPKLTSTRLSPGLDLSYEVDLWGRWSTAARAAVADARAAETDVQAARLLVAAEVARQYVLLAQAGSQTQVQAEAIAIAGERRAATFRLAQAGLAGAETLLEIDREIDQLRRLRAQSQRGQSLALHRLAALLGRAPADLSLTDVELRPTGRPR